MNTRLRISARIPFLLGALLPLPLSAAVAADGKPPATRETRVIERVAIPGTDQQMGLGIAEFPPHAEKPRHKAIGPEVCYVLEGEIFLEVDGKPTQHIRPSGSFQIPANVVHITRAGPAGAKVIASWAGVPGKTFNIPVPKN
ncbi:cupin [Herbaspirillum hiltneri N3]|uniref:Cupin n=1 Tax=Herbaspirillum hiltneri N3 TaxID=1262470 RepID=A0ABM5UVQ8_9BURK|nr:cupin domain-containing protein [Herbaspirillum hiltneri]AKZ61281.1 cupin [Herbaspirillum hiltneri N3]